MCLIDGCSGKVWKNGYCYIKHRKLAEAAEPVVEEVVEPVAEPVKPVVVEPIDDLMAFIKKPKKQINFENVPIIEDPNIVDTVDMSPNASQQIAESSEVNVSEPKTALEIANADKVKFFNDLGFITFPVGLQFFEDGTKKQVRPPPAAWQKLTQSQPQNGCKNFGIQTGINSDICGFDVDVKLEKIYDRGVFVKEELVNGFENLKAIGIDFEELIDYAIKIRTQSGKGAHYIFKGYDKRFKGDKNYAGVKGFDTRMLNNMLYAGYKYDIVHIGSKFGQKPNLDKIYNILEDHAIKHKKTLNTETPKTESPKTESPKTDTPKTETPSDEYSQKHYELLNIASDNFFNEYSLWYKSVYMLKNAFYENKLKHDVALNTAIKILKDRSASYNGSEIHRVWLNCKQTYDNKISFGSFIKDLQEDPNTKAKYEEWKAKWEPKKRTKTVSDVSISEAFMKTFSSELNNNSIKSLLRQMNKDWDDFENAMCDDGFNDTEIAHWFDKHCVITNGISDDFNIDNRMFERLLKTLNFYTRSLLDRFVMYFVNEFYVFASASAKKVYIRSKPNKANPKLLRSYNINDFDSISIKYTKNNTTLNVSLSKLLTQLPYHKFDGFCCAWQHDLNDTTIFSEAKPFKAKVLDEVVKEEDLLPEWLYWMKTIICFNDEEKWIWLRSYLANLFHQPDYRSGVMLLLYSPETRIGKSTLLYWLNLVFGEDNVVFNNNMGNVFGERGAPQLVNKKIGWIEELSESKALFRACMDRMKSTITDSRTSYRKLYNEVEETNNTCEYIAATNHLVGVLENRFSVFRVNPEKQGDTEFFGNLRQGLIGRETDKIITYLKDFTTPMPMKIIETKEYKSMLKNSSEHICSFITDIKNDSLKLTLFDRKNYQFTPIDDVYASYRQWCDSNGEKDKLTQSRFKEKMLHYGGQHISYKRIRVKEMNSALVNSLTFTEEFFQMDETEIEEEEEEED